MCRPETEGYRFSEHSIHISLSTVLWRRRLHLYSIVVVWRASAVGTTTAADPSAACHHWRNGPKIADERLDSLVAQIGLYPDPLLAQILAASTYPLEVIQLQQRIATNKYLKDQALADVVEMQPPAITGVAW